MLIYGAGGHGKVVLSLATDCQIQVISFFDDHCSPRITHITSIPIRSYDPAFSSEDPVIIAVGHNKVREVLANQIHHSFANLIHPSALVDSTVKIGVGNVFLHRSIVQANVVLANHIIVNTGAIIEHDCSLEDFVHVAPGAIICGGVRVGKGTLIGAGAIVIPGIEIGQQCIIGAGVIVNRHVPDHAVVKGGSTRIIRRF